MKIFNTLIAAILAVAALTSMKSDDVITIFMIGDSTMANKDISGGKLERGWGMMLQNCFSEDVRIDNHAVNGRSSKSFINEGRWDVVLGKIKPGDYVFIQFGHNDEKPQPERHTEPGSTFDDNLRKFVRETRERGGIPVIFNSVVRRNFYKITPKNDDDEALRNTTAKTVTSTKEEGDTLYDTHGDYVVAPRIVAEAESVVFIDANKITHDLEQGLGCEASKKLHMWFLPGEVESLPDGRQDNTHYNIYGATIVSRLLADAVAEQIPELAQYVRHYDIAVATDGTGQFFDIQEAVDNAPADRPITILVGEGQWTKPTIPEDKNIEFVLRSGASWQ